MKLSDYAKQQGVHYRTALRWFHDGKLTGRQLDTGTILVDDEQEFQRLDGIADDELIDALVFIVVSTLSHMRGRNNVKRNIEVFLAKLQDQSDLY